MPSSKIQFSDKYIQNLLRVYCEKNSEEINYRHFEKFLNSNKSLISRNNFLGHITASAILLDSTLSKILLVYHKNLSKFIQPGGHVNETDTTLQQTAIRELSEETGFTNILPISYDSSNPDIPIDIDIHIIPENQKKQEPQHQHFDFRYVFILLEDHQKNISEEKIGSIVWKPIKELEVPTSDLSRIARKVKNIVLSNRDEIFFN